RVRVRVFVDNPGRVECVERPVMEDDSHVPDFRVPGMVCGGTVRAEHLDCVSGFLRHNNVFGTPVAVTNVNTSNVGFGCITTVQSPRKDPTIGFADKRPPQRTSIGTLSDD